MPLISYGYSRAIPADLDKNFDVRDLSYNVRSPEFDAKLDEISNYAREHPDERIGIGCQHGKHRSVKLAQQAGERLKQSYYHT